MKKIVAIGNDHAGVEIKNLIMEKFKNEFEFINCGTNTEESTDYPEYAKEVSNCILNKKAAFGVLICGTGIGMSIAANRNKGIRASVCCHSQMARITREDNDANVLCLGARMLGKDVIFECFDIFSKTEFAGGRHKRRIDKLEC